MFTSALDQTIVATYDFFLFRVHSSLRLIGICCTLYYEQAFCDVFLNLLSALGFFEKFPVSRTNFTA